MRLPFGPPHLTLNPPKKTKKKKKQKQNKTKKTNKEGLGPSEVARRNKENKKKNKKTRKKRSQTKNSKNTQKLAFQLSAKFFFFWVAFQNFPFLTPWPRKRAPKQHYKNRGFRAFFLKSCCASRNGHFWTKKRKIYKFQLSLFLAYFLLFQQPKNPKIAETPIFLVF